MLKRLITIEGIAKLDEIYIHARRKGRKQPGARKRDLKAWYSAGR
jgi:hypothetical protein